MYIKVKVSDKFQGYMRNAIGIHFCPLPTLFFFFSSTIPMFELIFVPWRFSPIRYLPRPANTSVTIRISLLICLPVCLSVCLSVTSFAQKLLDRFTLNRCVVSVWPIYMEVHCEAMMMPVAPLVWPYPKLWCADLSAHRAGYGSSQVYTSILPGLAFGI